MMNNKNQTSNRSTRIGKASISPIVQKSSSFHGRAPTHRLAYNWRRRRIQIGPPVRRETVHQTKKLLDEIGIDDVIGVIFDW